MDTLVAQFKFQWEHVIGKSILNVRNPFQVTARFLFTLKTENVMFSGGINLNIGSK